MYKVLIVDDEPIVREGLEYIIDWEKFGFQVIDSAENGKIGLEKIERHAPQLVITDIRMPGMNGIDMVKESREKGFQTEFIILSGYSDFNYAKSVMSLGVFHYLLKPIEEEELMNALLDIKQLLQKKEEQKQTMNQYKDYELNAKIKTYLLSGQPFDQIDTILTHDSYRLIGFMSALTTKNKNDFLSNLHFMNDRQIYSFSHGLAVFLLLCETDRESLESIINEVLTVHQEPDLCIAVSREVYSIKDMLTLYPEIKQLQEKYYFFSDRSVLSFEILHQKEDKKQHVKFPPQALKEFLLKAVEKNDEKEIAEVLDMYKTFYREMDWSVEKTKANLSNLVLSCIDFLERMTEKPVKEQEKNQLVSKILSGKSLLEALELLQEIFTNFGKIFYDRNQKQDIVKEIVHYTKQNFHEELTLINLAKKFNYSHSYLGKKFRAEMGLGYNTFLDKVRIEEAKKLIQFTSMFVYEVAEKVGYSNADYFHIKFKKYVGISPKQYREKYMEANK